MAVAEDSIRFTWYFCTSRHQALASGRIGDPS
jgi:hypothetical protein